MQKIKRFALSSTRVRYRNRLISPLFLQTLDELRDMLIERLQAYASNNKGQLPDRIFLFRDGVSEVCSLIILI